MTVGNYKEQAFVVDERIRKMIAGAVAEVDPQQIAILRTLTPAQRFDQMVSMLNFTEISAADRLCQQEPTLSEQKALQIVRSGQMLNWIIEHRKNRGTSSDRHAA